MSLKKGERSRYQLQALRADTTGFMMSEEKKAGREGNVRVGAEEQYMDSVV